MARVTVVVAVLLVVWLISGVRLSIEGTPVGVASCCCCCCCCCCVVSALFLPVLLVVFVRLSMLSVVLFSVMVGVRWGIDIPA